VLVVFAAVADGQIIRPRSPFIMNIDYARFRNDSASTYLEIYYSFYGGSIGYAPLKGAFHGDILMSTLIRRLAKGDTLVLQNRKLPITVNDTAASSTRTSFVMQSGMALPNGSYQMTVFASDSLFPSQRDSIILPLTLLSYPVGITSSDLELCSEIRTAAQGTGVFSKNSLEVVPNPSLVFGASMHPVVFRYIEFYNLDTTMTYRVQGSVVDLQTGQILRSEQKTKRFRVKDAVDVGLQNVTSIRSGRYVYRITISDTLNNQFYKTEKVFYLNNPQIKQTQVSTSALTGTELAGMTADELKNEFREAKYLATTQEIKTFEGLTSDGGMREFLSNFWTAVAKGRSPMLDGISRRDYLHRIDVATQRYKAMGRAGWLTDRGRVYVLYGEPDEIQRVPSGEGLKPYEQWFFYQIESGVEFDFVDRSGFGDYILVNSTKRGEILDDQWQRFLQ
jgi:GWxTD domain-containing protein